MASLRKRNDVYYAQYYLGGRQVRIDRAQPRLRGARIRAPSSRGAEERSRLVYRIKVSVDNSSGVLKAGMPVEAELGLRQQ